MLTRTALAAFPFKQQMQAQPSVHCFFALPALGAAALGAGKFDPLPEAETEVKALGQLYGAAHSKVFTGAAARDRMHGMGQFNEASITPS